MALPSQAGLGCSVMVPGLLAQQQEVSRPGMDALKSGHMWCQPLAEASPGQCPEGVGRGTHGQPLSANVAESLL